MRTVVTNHEVCHLWAHQAQSEAHSGNNNLWFRDRTLYSYSTPIANIVDSVAGAPVALISETTYSPTTAGHIGRVRRALGGEVMPSFTVLFIGVYGGRAPRMSDFAALHPSNLAALAENFATELDRLRRRRIRPGDWERERAAEAGLTLIGYARTFGLTVAVDETAVSEQVAAAYAAWEERHARLSTPQAQAKRDAANANRQAKRAADYRNVTGNYGEHYFSQCRDEFTAEDQAARAATLAVIQKDRIAAWRAGMNISPPREPIMLRVRGNDIETSWGARFPIEDGRRAFALISRIVGNPPSGRGEAWRPGLHAAKLGPYQIDSIEADGTVRAGCHTVRWPEIERMARELGLIVAE